MYIETVAKGGGADKTGPKLLYEEEKDEKNQSEQAIKPDFLDNWLES